MLEEEQNFLCPYCELPITLAKSQIEHIKPKDKFPKEINNYLNYLNYLTGCIDSNHCGQYKSNKWSENFINPVLEDPEEYLTYDIMTGEIIPTKNYGNKYEKAKITIEILNLNNKKLCEARKIFIEQNKKTDYNFIDFYKQFPSLGKFLKENYKNN